MQNRIFHFENDEYDKGLFLNSVTENKDKCEFEIDIFFEKTGNILDTDRFILENKQEYLLYPIRIENTSDSNFIVILKKENEIKMNDVCKQMIIWDIKDKELGFVSFLDAEIIEVNAPRFNVELKKETKAKTENIIIDSSTKKAWTIEEHTTVNHKNVNSTSVVFYVSEIKDNEYNKYALRLNKQQERIKEKNISDVNIIDLMSNSLKNYVEEGKLKESIDKNVEKCVESAIKDMFSSYSDGAKIIKKKIEECLELNLDKINIQGYNKVISQLVSEKINNAPLKKLDEEITKSIDDTIGILEKQEWKLSEIMEKFIDSIEKDYDHMDEPYMEAGLMIEDEGNSNLIFIYFDESSTETNGILNKTKKEKEKYQMKNRLFISRNKEDENGKLFSFAFDEKNYHPLSSKCYNGFEKFLFKLYANQVTIILDEDECELEYSREDVD